MKPIACYFKYTYVRAVLVIRKSNSPPVYGSNVLSMH